jgi:hypothetical protein
VCAFVVAVSATTFPLLAQTLCTSEVRDVQLSLTEVREDVRVGSPAVLAKVRYSLVFDGGILVHDGLLAVQFSTQLLISSIDFSSESAQVLLNFEKAKTCPIPPIGQLRVLEASLRCLEVRVFWQC